MRRVRPGWAWVFAFALSTFASVTSLAAQLGGTGVLEGRVLDESGTPLPDVDITATRREGRYARAVTTDRGGEFRIGFLPPGQYRLSARRIGYRGTVVDPVTVGGGRVESVRVVLTPVAAQLDPVIVTVPAVQIRTEDTEFGNRLDSREIALLPVSNQINDLVAFTPGARPGQIWGAATAQANTYQLDGVGVNHPGLGGSFLELSPFWIEEFEVKGLGAGAEHGGFQGGIVNIVTKSGTNQLEGGVRLSGESHSLNGSNLRVSEGGTELGARREIDAQVRGPILKDRLFFAAFGQAIGRDIRVINRVRNLSSELVPLPPEDSDRRVLGKLTWQAGRRDFVTGSLGALSGAADRTGQDGFSSPEATRRRESRTLFYSVGWQRTMSSRALLELKVAGYDARERQEPYAGPDVPGLVTIRQVEPLAFQNAAFRELREPSSITLSAAADLSFRTASVTHHLRAGAEHSLGSWRYEQLRNGGLTWRPGERTTAPIFDPSQPASWVWNGAIASSWGGEVRIDSDVENSGAWLQDYIAITSRLHFNPGIRWGRWVGKLSPAGGSQITPVHDQAVEPRIGISWDVNGRGTLAVKAHWGRYHQGLFAGFFDRASGGNVFTDEERWEFLGQPFVDPRQRFTPAERDALAAGGEFRRAGRIRLNETGPVEAYHQPYVEQAILGVEKTFGGRWKAEALYARRRNRNMVGLVDRNIASTYTLYERVRVLDRFGAPLFFDGKPIVLPRIAVSNEDILYWWNEANKPGVVCPQCVPPELTPSQIDALRYEPDYALTNLPEATRRFDQLQLTFDGRYPGWWAGGSATITRLTGNLNSISGPDDYSASGAGPFVRLNEQFSSFGDLSNQSDVELKLRAGGTIGWGLSGGLYLTHFSGDSFTPTLTLSNLLLEFELDRPDLPQNPKLSSIFFETTAGHRVFLLPRGFYRYPAQTRLDLHIERVFRLGRAETLVSMDGFNVLAADTFSEIQTSVSAEPSFDGGNTYGRVKNRMPPRTLRLGAGVRF